MTPPIILAQHIVEKLKGTWLRDGGMCRCPAHADNGPSLSIRPGNTSILVHCFAGCKSTDVMAELRKRDLLSLSGNFIPQPTPPKRDFAELARMIWSESRTLGNTPAARYLRNRHIRHGSGELRFHPALRHYNHGTKETLPGMVARISNDQGLLAIHRIFLTPAGLKAPITFNKRDLGRPYDGSVRLHSIDDRRTLGIGEGIETCMSAHDIFNIPTWATLGTENFTHIQIPSHIQKIVLFLDNGRGGDRAEALFRARPDISSTIQTQRPPPNLSDWNDVARDAADEFANL